VLSSDFSSCNPSAAAETPLLVTECPSSLGEEQGEGTARIGEESARIGEEKLWVRRKNAAFIQELNKFPWQHAEYPPEVPVVFLSRFATSFLPVLKLSRVLVSSDEPHVLPGHLETSPRLSIALIQKSVHDFAPVRFGFLSRCPLLDYRQICGRGQIAPRLRFLDFRNFEQGITILPELGGLLQQPHYLRLDLTMPVLGPTPTHHSGSLAELCVDRGAPQKLHGGSLYSINLPNSRTSQFAGFPDENDELPKNVLPEFGRQIVTKAMLGARRVLTDRVEISFRS
jgi:hypothetical protein